MTRCLECEEVEAGCQPETGKERIREREKERTKERKMKITREEGEKNEKVKERREQTELNAKETESKGRKERKKVVNSLPFPGKPQNTTNTTDRVNSEKRLHQPLNKMLHACHPLPALWLIHTRQWGRGVWRG